MKDILQKFAVWTIFDSRIIIIYALNVSDYIFTLILIQSGIFQEINPILSMPINNFSGFILKCIIPFILLLYIRHRFRNAAERQIKPIKYILDCTIGIYAIINIFHICWLILMTFYLIPFTEQIALTLANS